MHIKKCLMLMTSAIAFSLVGCGDDSGSNAPLGTRTCTVRTEGSKIYVHQELSGYASYDAVGVYSQKNYTYDTYQVINYSYTEKYANSANYAEHCADLQEDSWYENVKCNDASRVITYTDYSEESIESAVADWQRMCAEFLE